MSLIQPFSFQFCTAFRERKQIADKVNEIIEILNSADLEGLPAEIERIDQNVANLSSYAGAVESNLTSRINRTNERIDRLEEWGLVPLDEQDTIYDENLGLAHDILIVLQVSDYILSQYVPKNQKFGIIRFSSMGPTHADSFIVSKANLTDTADTVRVDHVRYTLSSGQTSVDYLTMDKTKTGNNDKLYIYKRNIPDW